MSDSTLPATGTPLFLDRPPLLVVPAVFLLVLSARLAPRKRIFGSPKELSASERFTAQFSFPAISLSLSICLYTSGKAESPLTVETPLARASSEFPEARFCIILMLIATLMLALSQAMSVPIHVTATFGSPTATKGSWLAMMLVASAGFGGTMTGIFMMFGHPSSKQTFVQRVEAIMLWSEICVIVYDVLMVAVYYRMHRAASAETKALLYRLYGVVCLTLMVVLLLTNLHGVVFLLRMPQHGWLDSTLRIGGFVTALHWHMVACFLMSNEVVKHNDAQSAKSGQTEESVNLLESDAAAAANV
ncbi:hypothetical protein PsYK624_040410 [Phanerochaete sordida]|uniref:Uncharacterized protein n=1 Tax=Phanerochaete sordida TaxID=48140 RepID=A0A9P3LBE2_9APHY|nr:hypothetical protein PsYK624_040410 [Phanerochaete sordida]